MKKQIRLTACLFSTLFLIYSCEKDVLTFTPAWNLNGKKQSLLVELFRNLAPPMQNFTVTAGQQQVIVGEKGTKITFFSNSFKKKDGTILTSGIVKIVLQEMLTGPSMILAKKSTTSNGNILESRGQIFIKAFIGNEELLVNQNAKPEVNIPRTDDKKMNFFFGIVKENDSIRGDSIINWEVTKDTVKNVEGDTIGQGQGQTQGGYFSFKFGDFGYWNCDRLYNDPGPKTEMYIITPSGFVDSNTAVFIYFVSLNSVARCEGFNSETNTFFLNHNKASVGLSAKIVLVSKRDSKYYFDIKSTTVVDGFSTTMTPKESTEAAIKSAIESL